MQIAAIASTLAPLAVLACPIGMGAMMWMMARGGKTNTRQAQQAEERDSRPPSLEVLREEHQRPGATIQELERHSRLDETQPR